MKICAKCSAPLSNDEVFCTRCGTPSALETPNSSPHLQNQTGGVPSQAGLPGPPPKKKKGRLRLTAIVFASVVGLMTVASMVSGTVTYLNSRSGNSAEYGEPRPYFDYDNIRHYTEKEVLTAFAHEYDGNFSIVKKEEFGSHRIEYTVTNSDFPGLEFPATSTVSKNPWHLNFGNGDFIQRTPSYAFLYFRYQYEAALAQHLMEQYVQQHENFEVTSKTTESRGGPDHKTYCVVTYYYDSYTTIEEEMKAVEEFADYVREHFPFSANERFYMSMMSKDMYLLEGFERTNPNTYFGKEGFVLSHEERVAAVKEEYRNWILWSEYKFELLTEEEQVQYFEDLEKKAQEAFYSKRWGYYDYPVYSVRSSFQLDTWGEKYGLRAGSFYLLCDELGLEPRGTSWDYEVTGADGGTYRFIYNYDKPDGADSSADRGTYYYYKNGEPVVMPGGEKNHSIVTFSLIEEVLGYPLAQEDS